MSLLFSSTKHLYTSSISPSHLVYIPPPSLQLQRADYRHLLCFLKSSFPHPYSHLYCQLQRLLPLILSYPPSLPAASKMRLPTSPLPILSPPPSPQLQRGGYRRPLTIGNQISETHEQHRARPPLETSTAQFELDPQRFKLRHHHVEGPSKVLRLVDAYPFSGCNLSCC